MSKINRVSKSQATIIKRVLKGANCFICGRKSTVICKVCKKRDKPSGYCDLHKYISHAREFVDHSAKYKELKNKK